MMAAEVSWRIKVPEISALPTGCQMRGTAQNGAAVFMLRLYFRGRLRQMGGFEPPNSCAITSASSHAAFAFLPGGQAS
jgi:hypothetical protein